MIKLETQKRVKRQGYRKSLENSLNLDYFQTTMKTYSLSEAKQSLGKLADESLEGEDIVIIRKSKLLILKPFEVEIATPPRPAGYFKNCYDPQEEKRANSIAKRGPRKPIL